MVRRFFPRGTPFLHGRYANPSPGVRQRSWGVRCSFMDGTPVFPGGYAVESRPAPPTFMGSTPFSRPPEGTGAAEPSWRVRRFREARSFIGPRGGRFHGGYAVSALPWDEVGKGRCRVSGGCTTSARPCRDSRFAGRIVQACPGARQQRCHQSEGARVLLPVLLWFLFWCSSYQYRFAHSLPFRGHDAAGQGSAPRLILVRSQSA